MLSYGAVDTSPLFVMLLGELRRWGLAPEVVERLLPHADRALDWIRVFGDRDGDGYVEYQRSTDRGERHQGWKDSADPVRMPDGTPARGPLALVEVQAYVYAAYQARAHFAAEAGDDALAATWRERARELRVAFNRDFWVDDAGWLALALDGDKQPVPAMASNVGHCLWSGIVDEDKAAILAKHLLADDMFSGWGVRTLGASMGALRPARPAHGRRVAPRHRPVRGGPDPLRLRRRGAPPAARPARRGGGRRRAHGRALGFDRDDVHRSRAPARRLRHPGLVGGRAAAPPPLAAAVRPQRPPGQAVAVARAARRHPSLRVERIPLLGGSVSVTVDGGAVEVDDLPAGITVVAEPRRPLAAGS